MPQVNYRLHINYYFYIYLYMPFFKAYIKENQVIYLRENQVTY